MSEEGSRPFEVNGEALLHSSNAAAVNKVVDTLRSRWRSQPRPRWSAVRTAEAVDELTLPGH